MKEHTTSTAIPGNVLKAQAFSSMSASFEQFCVATKLERVPKRQNREGIPKRRES